MGFLDQISAWWAGFCGDVYTNIIADDRYLLYLEGLKNTLLMAAGAVVIGVLLGMIVAIIKVYAADNRKLRPLEALCNLYLAVIRGTPMVVQLLIMYYIVFKSAPPEMAVGVAMLAFGVNSGAYVAEIFRAGITSIDRGQMEAGRSLGLSKNTTMRYIILPQAIKNILPALFNEFIVLVKETSVAGYISIRDLTKAAELVRSRTFEPFIPLIGIALVYLVLVMVLTAIQRRIERRLTAGDKR